MRYLAFSGNSIVNAALPDHAKIYYPPPPIPGMKKGDIPRAVKKSFENPLGMPPLRDLVHKDSRILIAFDDNCQPFPPMKRPDIRQIIIETLLSMLYSFGVKQRNIQLICAVSLHRKMKKRELTYMLGGNIMAEFYPDRLKNFDAEDSECIVRVGETDEGEIVEVEKAVVDSDLVIYVDSNQIPLNGGHKSVAVGLGTYQTIACHHSPHMTADSPHVMQPQNSDMHTCIERMSRLIQKHALIMVLEAPMNGATYPFYLQYLSKSYDRCNGLEKTLKLLTPVGLKLLPEWIRYNIFRYSRSVYDPIEIHAGSIDEVHKKTLATVKMQLRVPVPRQFNTLVFGLPDLSPYSVGTHINPVLAISDVLGYIFNWFYNKPLVKRGGVVIILNPVFEKFHKDYHVPYRKFYDEVLRETTDPFEMQKNFQEKFALDPYLIDCYRNRFAFHGFHPFTVWYWTTYSIKYLSRVILVGPRNDTAAKRLGVSWASDLNSALDMAEEINGSNDVVALSIPPFLYVDVQ